MGPYKAINAGEDKVDADINNKKQEEEFTPSHSQHRVIPTVPVKDTNPFFDHIRYAIFIDESTTGTGTVAAESGIDLRAQVIFSEYSHWSKIYFI
jgi:hypothetical protein